jgi:hypothetical protein
MADAAAANARVRNGHVRVRPIDIDRSRPAQRGSAAQRPIKRGCGAGKSTWMVKVHTHEHKHLEFCMQAIAGMAN